MTRSSRRQDPEGLRGCSSPGESFTMTQQTGVVGGAQSLLVKGFESIKPHDGKLAVRGIEYRGLILRTILCSKRRFRKSFHHYGAPDQVGFLDRVCCKTSTGPFPLSALSVCQCHGPFLLRPPAPEPVLALLH